MAGDIVRAAEELATNNTEVISEATKAAGEIIKRIKSDCADSSEIADQLKQAIVEEGLRFKVNHDWILAYGYGEGVYDMCLKGIEHLTEAARCLVKAKVLSIELALVK